MKKASTAVDRAVGPRRDQRSGIRSRPLQVLQRALGNESFGVLQAKLTLGQPGDKYEEEADRAADEVMRMGEPPVQRREEPEAPEDEDIQAKPLAGQITPLVQRRGELKNEEEKLLRAMPQETEHHMEPVQPQSKAAGPAPQVVLPTTASRIESLRGRGKPLPATLRSFFEPRFGHHFHSVRLHTSPEAAVVARELHARAFTVGRDVVLGRGEFQPESTEGRQLLAHELTHVLQQNAGATKVVRRWESEIAAAGFNPADDLLKLLGSSGVTPEPSTERELFLYLKRLRRALPRPDPELEQSMESLLEKYFPGRGSLLLEKSRMPLAGYTGTSNTRGGAPRRLEEAKKLGMAKAREKSWKRKFEGSDIIIFSGHHYAEPQYGNDPGRFDDLDVRRIHFTSEKAKLVMISSCAGLRSNALQLWKKRFPNATILGWRTASPTEQKGMMKEFLNRLPENLLLDEDMEVVIARWKSHIEDLARKKPQVVSQGRELGYATPDGSVTYYRYRNGNWEWVTM